MNKDISVSFYNQNQDLINFKQSNPDRVKAPYQLDQFLLNNGFTYQFLIDILFPFENTHNGFNYTKDDVSVVNIDNKIIISKGFNTIFRFQLDDFKLAINEIDKLIKPPVDYSGYRYMSL